MNGLRIPVEPLSTDTILVTVYHQCAYAATGSALGPGTTVSYWWVNQERCRVVTDGGFAGHRDLVERAVLDALQAPGGAIRRAQDEVADL